MKLIKFALLLSIVALISGCKASTFEEAIENQIGYEINEIIHQEPLDINKSLIFYTFDTAMHNNVLHVALVKGNSEEGWDFLGPQSKPSIQATHDMSIRDLRITYENNNNVYVNFGYFDNPNIATVEVGSEQKGFVQANIIEKGKGRYFYRIYDEEDIYIIETPNTRGSKGMEVRFLSDKGTIIYKGY